VYFVCSTLAKAIEFSFILYFAKNKINEMADQYTNMNNLRFLLYDVHKVEDLLKAAIYKDFDREGIDILLDATKDLADQEFHPYCAEMDEKPVRYEDGKVIAHPQLGVIIEKCAEAGVFGSYFSYENGGMQLPMILFGATNHIYHAANNHVVGYMNLTTGAANLIATFGNQQLIDTYLPNMVAGKWMGTMALTEPQAGSSLSDVKTSALPQGDGTYKIKGQKIFISGGDHQFGENFIHLTLARIEGAPAGTKGISLFVVPKHRPDADGSLTYNDVITAGDFQKMGQKGYATTHLVFGEGDNCQGYLVGQPNLGLKYMFQMMNEARVDVGHIANSIATAAYHASLQYAKERPQGRRLSSDGSKNVSEEQTLIIHHPDVRRMLLLQKAVTEGGLSLLLECGKLTDVSITSEGEEKENAHLLLELLTPIAKTYPSEMGRIATSNGLQILGGYGFCNDFPLQQYYRDIRITSLYEGTSGIQSMDLLGRKVTMQNGRALQLLVNEMTETIRDAANLESLKPYADLLAEKMKLTQRVLAHLSDFALKGDYERFLADASIFMEFTSTVVIAWQWLKQAVISQKALVTGVGSFTTDFYESKLLTMKFYFKYELPKTTGLAEVLMHPDAITILKEKDLID
jgi:alkylation response protein AidB-like acyl-CoA dehydrogenase